MRTTTSWSITGTEKLLENKYGRPRDAETATDGSFVVLAEDGRLIQLKM